MSDGFIVTYIPTERLVLAMEWSRAPHVAVVLNASAGHAIPCLQFSRRLAAEGIVTTVVTSDRHVRELEKIVGSRDLTAHGEPLRLLGLRDKKEELSHDEWRRRVCDVPEERLAVIRLLEEVVKDVASPQSWDIRGVSPATPPLCILYDMFVTWAGEAAANLHIEKHLLYVSPAACLSVDLQVCLAGNLAWRKSVSNKSYGDIAFTHIPC